MNPAAYAAAAATTAQDSAYEAGLALGNVRRLAEDAIAAARSAQQYASETALQQPAQAAHALRASAAARAAVRQMLGALAAMSGELQQKSRRR